MKTRILLFLFFLSRAAGAQDLAKAADSIRIADSIPELAYAIIRSDSLLIKKAVGYHRNDLQDEKNKAKITDYFHLGSNTKAITGFLAGYLVEQKKISWNTKFFSLFPELKKEANPDFYEMTLIELLSHRARIKPYTSGAEFQALPVFKGLKAEQRQQFVEYLIKNDALSKSSEAYNYSNAGFSIAARMLEKASGRTWEQLLDDVLAKKLGLRYKLSWPNRTDLDQPWGHWMDNGKLVPLSATTTYDLKLIEPSGDISMPLVDYAKFIQMNLSGLKGKGNLLSPETYNFLHYGREQYAVGWLNVNKPDTHSSEHAGSAGTFYCYTLINRDKGVAYIIIANSATERTLKGIFSLFNAMVRSVE